MLGEKDNFRIVLLYLKVLVNSRLLHIEIESRSPFSSFNDQ